MVYGYVRISTKRQSIERQIRNIKAAFPDAVVVKEVFTRTRLDRPEWLKLMKRVRTGDTIVFDSVSRMSGNAEDGFTAYQELYNRGINLVFLKESHIDTAVYKQAMQNSIPRTGSTVDIILQAVEQYLMELAKEQIRLAFAQSEKEVTDLQQRTREGIETARLAGKQIGQPAGAKLITKKSLVAKDLIKKHSWHFDGTLNDSDTMKLAGISRNTFYKYKCELMEEDA